MMVCKFGRRRVTEGMGSRDRGNIVLERCQVGPLYLTRKQNTRHSMRSALTLAFWSIPNPKWDLGRRGGCWGSTALCKAISKNSYILGKGVIRARSIKEEQMCIYTENFQNLGKLYK